MSTPALPNERAHHYRLRRHTPLKSDVPVRHGLRPLESQHLVRLETAPEVPVLIGVGFFVFVEVTITRGLADYRGDGTYETWTITDDDVRVDLPNRSLVHRWDACRDAKVINHHWVLRFPGMQHMGFPVGVLSEAQGAAFERLLRERSLLK